MGYLLSSCSLTKCPQQLGSRSQKLQLGLWPKERLLAFSLCISREPEHRVSSMGYKLKLLPYTSWTPSTPVLLIILCLLHPEMWDLVEKSHKGNFALSLTSLYLFSLDNEKHYLNLRHWTFILVHIHLWVPCQRASLIEKMLLTATNRLSSPF